MCFSTHISLEFVNINYTSCWHNIQIDLIAQLVHIQILGTRLLTGLIIASKNSQFNFTIYTHTYTYMYTCLG